MTVSADHLDVRISQHSAEIGVSLYGTASFLLVRLLLPRRHDVIELKGLRMVVVAALSATPLDLGAVDIVTQPDALLTCVLPSVGQIALSASSIRTKRAFERQVV
jgi:hypothetical protein